MKSRDEVAVQRDSTGSDRDCPVGNVFDHQEAKNSVIDVEMEVKAMTESPSKQGEKSVDAMIQRRKTVRFTLIR